MSKSYRLVVAARDFLPPEQLKEVSDSLAGTLEQGEWFEIDRIYTWQHVTDINQMTVEGLRSKFPTLDFCLFDKNMPKPKLLLSDMDATMIVGESIDEMAAVLGLHDKISGITARAMAGELDFAEALEERVGLLKGLPISAVKEIGENIQLQAGAKELLSGLKQAGIRCVLVSGGFTIIAEMVTKTLGFDHFHANVLGLDGENLSGFVQKPYVGKEAKLDLLNAQCTEFGFDLSQTVTLGDGANDIAMLQAAGIGCGFEGKELVKAATPYQINVTDLRTLLAYLDIKPV